jgi:CubicO group peptidase (beta-lactamase class C family)
LLLAALHHHYTQQQFLHDLHDVSLDTIPGARYRYSNAGAQLLAILLENAYHQSLAELTRTFITVPLQMHDTYTAFPAGDPALAQGYDGKGRAMPPIPADMSAAGGIYSSVADLLQYIRFQLDECNATTRLSHRPTDTYTDSTAIGLFWRIHQSGQLRKIWHTGGTFGFSSYCALYPEAHFGIIVLSNEFDPGSQAALVQLADKIFSPVTRSEHPVTR